MPLNRKFYTKAGRLRPYGFACGYIETWQAGCGSNNRLTLEMEHNCYHIKGFINGQRVWETARTVTEARKIFAQQRRNYNPECAKVFEIKQACELLDKLLP